MTENDDMKKESTIVRWWRALAALRRLTKNPNDTQQVFELSERVNSKMYIRVLAELETSESGRRLLGARPAIDSASLHQCRLMPPMTLGKSYADFMDSRGLAPDIFQSPIRGKSVATRYIEQRMRQTHDLWHVLTGYGTDPDGELELQAFTYGQVRAPLALMIMIGGTLRAPWMLRRMRRAFRRGVAAKRLVSIDWEQQWQRDANTVKTELALL
jgi:ubiquinone biosynthesis protein COQ4